MKARSVLTSLLLIGALAATALGSVYLARRLPERALSRFAPANASLLFEFTPEALQHFSGVSLEPLPAFVNDLSTLYEEVVSAGDAPIQRMAYFSQSDGTAGALILFARPLSRDGKARTLNYRFSAPVVSTGQAYQLSSRVYGVGVMRDYFPAHPFPQSAFSQGVADAAIRVIGESPVNAALQSSFLARYFPGGIAADFEVFVELSDAGDRYRIVTASNDDRPFPNLAIVPDATLAWADQSAWSFIREAEGVHFMTGLVERYDKGAPELARLFSRTNAGFVSPEGSWLAIGPEEEVLELSRQLAGSFVSVLRESRLPDGTPFRELVRSAPEPVTDSESGLSVFQGPEGSIYVYTAGGHTLASDSLDHLRAQQNARQGSYYPIGEDSALYDCLQSVVRGGTVTKAMFGESESLKFGLLEVKNSNARIEQVVCVDN